MKLARGSQIIYRDEIWTVTLVAGGYATITTGPGRSRTLPIAKIREAMGEDLTDDG